MNFKMFVFCFCLVAAELNCQVVNQDSLVATRNKPDTPVYNNQDTSTILRPWPNNMHKVNDFSLSDDLFLLNLHFPYRETNLYSNYQSPVTKYSLTSSIEYQLPGTNKELAGYLNYVYMQSKPSKLQEILGVVNISGAAALAGYHIWKYYIKKDK
jgi:hypothetical protein